MSNLRSTAAANPFNATPARSAIALQRGNRRKVDALFKDFDKVRPVVTKRDLVFRICTKLDMLSQADERDFYPALQQELQGSDAQYAASQGRDGGAVADEGTEAPGRAADSPDMFSIGSRVAGRMEQIMGALHA